MKNLLPVFILMLLAAPAIAQDWQGPLRWLYLQDEFLITPDVVEYLEIIKTKDTLVQAKSCVVLLERQVHLLEDGTLDTLTFGTHTVCYDEDKTYYYVAESGQLALLYDFGLSVGDTMTSHCPWTGERVLSTIDSIEMIEIGGREWRMFWLTDLFLSGCDIFPRLIQGVGPLDYPFPRPAFVDPAPGGQLLCFTDGTIYLPNGNACSILSPTQEPDDTPALSIFPNPVTDLATIRGGAVREIQVYDSLGRRLRTANHTNEITFNGLPPGLYHLLIRLEDGGYGWYKVVH